jgi:hypothetical protein
VVSTQSICIVIIYGDGILHRLNSTCPGIQTGRGAHFMTSSVAGSKLCGFFFRVRTHEGVGLRSLVGNMEDVVVVLHAALTSVDSNVIVRNPCGALPSRNRRQSLMNWYLAPSRCGDFMKFVSSCVRVYIYIYIYICLYVCICVCVCVFQIS